LEHLSFRHQDEAPQFLLAVFQMGFLKSSVLDVQDTPFDGVIFCGELDDPMTDKDTILLLKISFLLFFMHVRI